MASGTDPDSVDDAWIEVLSDKSLEVVKGRILRSTSSSKRNHFSLNIPLGLKPVKDLLVKSLLLKGNKVKIWGWQCGSGGFLSVRSILINPIPSDLNPVRADSFLNMKPIDAIEKIGFLSKEIDSLSKQAQNEVDQEVLKGLGTAQKGEFETTDAANLRLKRVQQLRWTNNKKYEAKIIGLVHPKLKEYSLLMHSLYPSEIYASLGIYDADMEMFPILLGQIEIAKVSVPLNMAKELKNNFASAKVYKDFSISDELEGTLKVETAGYRIIFRKKQFLSEPP